MKLKFNPNLKYQDEAVKSVIDLFEGQNSMLSYFTVSGQQTINSTGQGVGNKIDISASDILENLRKVQKYHKIAPSESLNENHLDFNIEMETGTGKTYVYLKTIFELNKIYGFTKFIIVVPSVAIKEGVYKTIEITRDHFKGLYDNVIYNSFVYDSSKLEQIRNFATDSNIEIMIINIDAFNKSFTDPSKETKANIIHRENDRLSGYKPIELIQETNPIVIIDEPQSVMGGKGEKAVKSLNPLCTLRYSATHKEIQNLIYKLDAVDAYEMNLVKQIEVAGFESQDFHNKAYMKLIETNNKKSPITAKIEIDKLMNGSIKRKTVTVKQGDDLFDISGRRDVYENYIVDEIYCEEGNEYVSFTQKDEILRIGKIFGDMDDLVIKRAQIRKTIEEHFDKELSLNEKGIKVLSLFFIDKVANYRQYDEDGNPIKGPYAKIFEEEYEKVIRKPKYNTLIEKIEHVPVEEVHNGYFSVDKKGKVKDSRETKKGKLRANKDDESTFNLIMRDKEKLLSFDSNLKFIFSHSALKEGWDNPNVFQICTLNETSSTMKKRQEIGRGLRLCVNQDGERIKDNNINILTVMANESYSDFAKKLQSEMENDTGIKFGTIEKTSFAHIIMENKNGKKEAIGSQKSFELFNHFKKMKYINGKGKVQDTLKQAIIDNTVEVPEKYESIKEDIVSVAKRQTKHYEIKNANNKRKVKVNKHVFLSDDFKEFWDKIKHKTTYSVEFDTDELIEKCCNALKDELNIKPPKLIYTKSGLTIDASGVNYKEGTVKTVYSDEDEIALPNILKFLQNTTSLTRKTIIKILIESETLDQFKKNPTEYMNESSKIIKRVMSSLIVDGVKYSELDDYYSQQLFENEELWGYLNKNIIESHRSVYDHIVYDSEVEKNFAERLENDDEVELYTKLPGWFKIATPIGGYNPDWAILFNKDGERKMYFVVETKGTKDITQLRPSEQAKIKCGKKHFEALGSDVELEVTNSYEDLKSSI